MNKLNFTEPVRPEPINDESALSTYSRRARVSTNTQAPFSTTNTTPCYVDYDTYVKRNIISYVPKPYLIREPFIKDTNPLANNNNNLNENNMNQETHSKNDAMKGKLLKMLLENTFLMSFFFKNTKILHRVSLSLFLSVKQ